LKSAEVQALKKAEMAEAAKRAVESELRRWREREQQKRAVTVSSTQSLTNSGNIDSITYRFGQNKSIYSESLAEVLNINIPSPEPLKAEQSVDGYVSLKKKKATHSQDWTHF